MSRASLLRFFVVMAGGGAAAAACQGHSYPSVDCHQPVWVAASEATSAAVIGSWDGWKAAPQGGVVAQPSGHAGWKLALLALPPGEYGYQVVTDGAVGLDPYQPLTTFRGEQEVSLLVAADCSSPALHITSAGADAKGALSVAGTFAAAAGGPALDARRVQVTLDGAAVAGARVTAVAATGAFTVSASGLARGKHTVTVAAADEHGKSAPEARAAVWVQPAAETWEDAVLYQIVTDRFRADGGLPLAPPATPGTRAGGTLGGITAEIERGTFAALGVTALWISPVYTNPDGFLPDGHGHLEQGYHGYWLLDDRAVEPRIGGEAALDALIASAHAHGLRVLFDIVPNQVYEQNPIYLAHQSDGWFNVGPRECICGAPGCDWGTSCWFASYLPDVRYQDDGAMHNAIGDALFWMSRFDADGVRIDAVPLTPRATTRRIVRALRDSEAPARSLFALGEVFTGEGVAGLDQIQYFLGPNGLDSAFDFPLMWALRDAVAYGADGSAGFDAVESILASTESALAGSGSVPARMLDNHDTARFISEADGARGDDLADPWGAPPPQPTSASVYQRQRLALAVIFALPGMPVIYYGDEIGLAGASDPDSRRVMPALDGLPSEQATTLALTRKLGVLRGCSTALRRGARVPIWADATTYAFARDAGDGAPVVALFSTSMAPATVTIPGGIVPDGGWVDAVSGARVTLAGATTITLDPLSFQILVPSTSACHP